MIGIGDYDAGMRNRKKVCTRLDQIMYKGKKYRQDKKTGYYVCTTGSRKRLHVAIWEDYWGIEVPRGCVIHHLDWNKTDNVIENLICVTQDEHNKIHNILGGEAGLKYGYRLVSMRTTAGLPPGIDI